MKFSILPFLNIMGKKGRSSTLFVFSALLSFSLFGGALMLSSLRNGLKSLERRLGADIIVVPYEARTKVSADTILAQGNRTYFYMPKSTLDKVLAVEGVEKVSPQVYMCTMNAGCCSVSLQLVGFDPRTDFTIQPWVRQTFSGTLQTGEILIGSKVNLSASGKLKFFDQLWTIAAQLDETGTGLDNAVFANMETIALMAKAAEKIGWPLADKKYSDKMISTIMVKSKDGYDIDDVASLIQRKVRKTQAVKAKSMTSAIADSLASFSMIIAVLSALVWLLCLIILIVVSILITGERKKEFAVLRVMGASKKKVSRLVMAESLLLNAAGGACGTALASLCIFPFHSLIKNAIGLPFLLPEAPVIIALALGTLAASVFVGLIASSFSAMSISKVDAGAIIRDGN